MTDVLSDLGARVAGEQDLALAAAPLPSSDSLLAAVARRRRRAETRARALGLAAASLLLALVVALGGIARSRGLFERGDAALASPAAAPALGVTDAEARSVPIAFADGTKVVVRKGARAELREVRPHGASIVLDRGVLRVDVVHTDGSRWDVTAGPFGIRVTGTRFDATWDPEAKRLTVAMIEGTVEVSGPCVDERLSAPATKVFACSEDRPVLASAPSAAPLSPPKPAVTKPAHAARADGPSSPSAGASSSAPSAAALVERADAARLAGDVVLARELYVDVRARFPGTPQAGRSAFLLGRMAQASGALDEAVAWFEIAARDERGAYAQEALGRWTEIEQSRGDVARARVLAADYLKRHPGGPYARYAASVAAATE